MNNDASPLELRLFSLLQKVRDEHDAAARTELNALLRDHAEARQLMANALVNEQALISRLRDQSIVSILSPEPAAQAKITNHWLQWRPLAAAAAGVVCGLFTASMVFGFVVPKPFRDVPIFVEGFENSPKATRHAFPLAADEWGGDLSAAVGAEGKVTPAEGSRMVRLMKTEKAKRRLSYAWRIVDLAELPAATSERPLRIEVTAAFAGAEPERAAHYQIRLAAFSQAPADVRALWNNEPLLFDTVLQHVGRNVHTMPGKSGWQTVQAGMQIPAGTRSIVISLGAGDEASDSAAPSAHYLDDVRASFVVTRASAE